MELCGLLTVKSLSPLGVGGIWEGKRGVTVDTPTGPAHLHPVARGRRLSAAVALPRLTWQMMTIAERVADTVWAQAAVAVRGQPAGSAGTECSTGARPGLGAPPRPRPCPSCSRVCFLAQRGSWMHGGRAARGPVAGECGMRDTFSLLISLDCTPLWRVRVSASTRKSG